MSLSPNLINLDKPMEQRLAALHQRALHNVPSLSRISCSLYYKNNDLLRTYVHSTRAGHALVHYEYPLANSQSLSQIANTGVPRLLKNVRDALRGCSSEHSQWLLTQQYQSSFTVPMYNRGEFIGFIFYDADTYEAFTPLVQKDLLLTSMLITMSVALEFDLVQNILASTKVANEFMHLRDFETGAHLERMAQYARLIATALSEPHSLNDEYIERLYQVAPLHDIGKIGVPDSILLKPGKLDSQEQKIMRGHVEKGVDLAQQVLRSLGILNASESHMVINVIGQHHEYLDGSGYPRGLRGEEVSLEARIVTVSDIFDALNSKRPYKEGWPLDASFAELNAMVEQGKIDGDCVSALKENTTKIHEIISNYQDNLA